MISEAEALERIFAAIEPSPSEVIAVERAAGFFAATSVYSTAALPRFDQSAMDGYAVRAANTPGNLRITGEQPAGAARGLEVGDGEAVRIFTGAPLPAGADAVVMQEDVVAGEDAVYVADAVPPDEFIRRRGEDVCEGQCLVAAGDAITPARIGLLVAAGIEMLSVHRRPRMALVTTGNELRPIGAHLAPGELHDSNRPMLAALLAPFADVAGSAHASDDPAALAETIRSFADVDAIVLSAGVSVGTHDPVHAALRELGATVDLWRVAVKPGKPFLFARLGAQRIFGLPGNPVSTFVTAHLFVQPALRKMAGSSDPSPPRWQIPLGVPAANPGDRVLYLRATFRNGQAFPTPLQQSHGLASLAAADLLIRLEPGAIHDPGSLINAFPLNFQLTQVFYKY